MSRSATIEAGSHTGNWRHHRSSRAPRANASARCWPPCHHGRAAAGNLSASAISIITAVTAQCSRAPWANGRAIFLQRRRADSSCRSHRPCRTQPSLAPTFAQVYGRLPHEAPGLVDTLFSTGEACTRSLISVAGHEDAVQVRFAVSCVTYDLLSSLSNDGGQEWQYKGYRCNNDNTLYRT